MGKMETFAPPPPAAVSRLLATFDREQLAGFIEVAIGLLDVADGDVDLEANNDELDGSGAEDDFQPQTANWRMHPGCPISDPGEEDDPSGLCDEDEVNTNLEFRLSNFGPGCTISDDGGCNVEDGPQLDDGEHGMTSDWALDQTKALPDMMVLQSDLSNTRAHRNRIRAEACNKITRYGVTEYRLRELPDDALLMFAHRN